MNYQDYIKYDPEKKQYTDSYGYVIDGYSSKALGVEQRAQQPAKVNRVSLIDTDSGVDPIVQAAGSDSTNLILDARGSVKTTKSLVVGSSNTNQAQIDTYSNGISLQAIGGATSGDIIFVPKGLGVVNCASYITEMNTGMMSTQTLGTNVNTKVRFDNTMFNNFPAGFITKTDIGGGVYDTFQNTSGRTIAIMVTACIRETTFPTGRTLGLWITRTGDSTLRYGQALLPPTTDTTNGRALNIASIIRLADSESFSIWAHTVAADVVIGGNGSLYNRPILSYRLMP